MRHECVPQSSRERRIAARPSAPLNRLRRAEETRLQESSNGGVGGVACSPPRSEAQAEAKRERRRRIIGGGLVIVGPRVVTGIIGTMAIAVMAVAGMIIAMAIVVTDVAARADIGRPGAYVGRWRCTNGRRHPRRGGDRFNPTWTNDKHDHRQNGCTDPFHHR